MAPVWIAAVLCATLATQSAGWAQGDADADVLDQQGRKLYLEAESNYAAGRYQQAAELFERAYELTRRPELLFNIGNAYERTGEFRKAAHYLRRYAASPSARGAELIHERVGRLDAAADAKAQQQASLKTVAAEAPQAGGAEPDRARRPSTVPAYAVLGTGGALLGASLVFALLANGAGNKADEGCTDGLCLETVQGDLDRQRKFGITSYVTLGVGAAVVGAGAYLLYRALRHRPEQRSRQARVRFSPALTAGGLAGGLTVAF